MSNMRIKTVFGSPVVNGECTLSNVALARMEAGAFEGKVVCEGADVLAARYDAQASMITLILRTAQGTEEACVAVRYDACSHPHPVAQERMCALDTVALHAPDGKIALIGDSLFHNWAAPDIDMGMPGEVVNLGVGGFCIPDLKHLVVPRLLLPCAPSCIVVHVGINDMFQAGVTREEYLNDAKAFFEWLHALLPAAQICFLSIVRPTDIAPTVSGIVGAEADARRDAIDAANAQMRLYCCEHAWTTYLDAEAAYCDANGRSRVELFHADGIHLLPEAYPAWGAAIAAAIFGA